MQNINIYIRPLLLLCGLLLAFFFLGDIFSWPEIQQADLIQYWAAARLFVDGQNPYDTALLLQMEQSTAFGAEHLKEAIVFYNPPITLSLIFWLGYLSFEQAKLIWFLLAFGSLLGCSLTWFHLINKRQIRKSVVYLSAALLCTFPPIHHILFFGQISFFLIIALTIWWYLYFQLDRQFLSGVALSMVLIKPHLLYLLLVVFAIDFLRGKNLPVNFGLGFGLILLVLVPLRFNPQVFEWYYNFSQSPPIFWMTPTLGSFLQDWTGEHTLIMRSLPTLAGALILTFCYLLSSRHFLDQKFVLLLIPASLFSAMYGWVFDQILLLPTAVYCLLLIAQLPDKPVFLRLVLILGVFSENIFTALQPPETGQHNYAWYPLLLFLITFILQQRQAHASEPQAAQ